MKSLSISFFRVSPPHPSVFEQQPDLAQSRVNAKASLSPLMDLRGCGFSPLYLHRPVLRQRLSHGFSSCRETFFPPPSASVSCLPFSPTEFPPPSCPSPLRPHLPPTPPIPTRLSLYPPHLSLKTPTHIQSAWMASQFHTPVASPPSKPPPLLFVSFFVFIPVFFDKVSPN